MSNAAGGMPRVLAVAAELPDQIGEVERLGLACRPNGTGPTMPVVTVG